MPEPQADPNSTAPPENSPSAYVDLGVISFEQFLEAIRSPPATQVGFEIRPEDQQRYRQYMDSQPK